MMKKMCFPFFVYYEFYSVCNIVRCTNYKPFLRKRIDLMIFLKYIEDENGYF